jgi:hypothetical protein
VFSVTINQADVDKARAEVELKNMKQLQELDRLKVENQELTVKYDTTQMLLDQHVRSIKMLEDAQEKHVLAASTHDTNMKELVRLKSNWSINRSLSDMVVVNIIALNRIE